MQSFTAWRPAFDPLITYVFPSAHFTATGRDAEGQALIKVSALIETCGIAATASSNAFQSGVEGGRGVCSIGATGAGSTPGAWGSPP